MATVKNLNHYIGDTKVINVNFTDSSSTPIDITGGTVYLTVKSSISDADVSAVFQKIVTTHTNAALGQSQIKVLPADTSGQTAGIYVYDIQLIQADGTVSTVLYGNYTLLDEVTKTNA